MRIDHVRLENYRCFAELDVNFHPRMTVLVAENGQGKTTVLDAVKVALWPYVAGFDLGSTTNDITGIHRDDVRREQVVPHAMEPKMPAYVRASGQMPLYPRLYDFLQRHRIQPDIECSEGNATWQTSRWRESIRKGTKTKDSRSVSGFLSLKDVATGLEAHIFSGDREQPFDLPMLGYYGTCRLCAQKSLTASHEKEDPEVFSRTFAYRDCLDPLSNYKHFAHWFTRIFRSFRDAQIRNIEKGNTATDVPVEYAAPVQAVQHATNAMLESHTGWHTLEYSAEYDDLILNHDQHGQLRVSQLSDGIRNMLALVGDIAHRCYKLNAHLGQEATQVTRGIVMIDEVDMHLHPGWQQTVLSDLSEVFPRLQFIVTTHSPQVLTTVPSECIRILRDNRVYAAPAGTEGAEPQRLLKQVLGLKDIRPSANMATRELTEYLSLVDRDQWNSPRALELRQKLDARYQGQEPALLDADLQIENRKWEMGE